jgi:integrative and conjugative element protein (TIGR02256 family)
MPDVCWIEPDALAALRREARAWPVRETGGALFGWQEGDKSVVAAILGPGPEASHGLSHFEPDVRWQQEEGERIYHESGRTIAYIGDWHSHPHGGPQPSTQDRLTAREIADDPGFRTPEPLYAIASKYWFQLRRPDWRLRMMRLRDGRLRDTELRRMPTGRERRGARSSWSTPPGQDEHARTLDSSR